MEKEIIKKDAEQEAELFWNTRVTNWYPDIKDAVLYTGYFILKLAEMRNKYADKKLKNN